MSEGKKQDVGITIVNEGQDAQRVLFARIDGTDESNPQVLDNIVLEPGQEVKTTIRAGLIVQVVTLPEGMEAANDDQVQQPQGESEA